MGIKAPNFQKDAVPTTKGWHHPRTGELLKSQKITPKQIDEYLMGEEIEIPAEISEANTITHACPVCRNSNCSCSASIYEMSKDQLEEYAKEKFGVDIDRRYSLSKLIEQVEQLEIEK